MAITHYIEKYFNRNCLDLNSDLEICRVDSRDPLMIEEEKDLVGFRFFDVEEVIFDDEHRNNLGSLKNYSGMYYFGKRITYKDFILVDDDFIKKLQLDYLNRLGVEEAIFCENAGKVISSINSGDKTIDEVKIERINDRANTIFISQKQWFDRIVEALETCGNDVDVIVSEVVCPLCDMEIDSEVDSITSIVRTYDLYINGYKSISSSAIVGDCVMGAIDSETYIR